MFRDSHGNLYGTTQKGGAYNYGAIFEITREGAESILLSLSGPDGATPFAGLTRDSKGNLYGTAIGGGIDGDEGYGTVFELQADGTEKVLHVFTGKRDGGYPEGGVYVDPSGAVYGTTSYGGTHLAGVIFEIVP